MLGSMIVRGGGGGAATPPGPIDVQFLTGVATDTDGTSGLISLSLDEGAAAPSSQTSFQFYAGLHNRLFAVRWQLP